MSMHDLELHGMVRVHATRRHSHPELKNGDQKIIAVLFVSKDKNNIALSAKNRFTVDWGDGVIQNFKSGDVATHSYDFDNLTVIPNADGFKEVTVKISPQNRYNLTEINFDPARESATTDLVSSALWVKIDGSLPNLCSSTLSQGVVKNRHPRLKHYSVSM